MAFVVVYDACVLYPPSLRDLLVRIARTGVVRACWSDAILEECFRSIRRQTPSVDPAALARTRELLGIALPGAMVTGFEPLIDGLTLPDADDRHVLAAAIEAGAQAIVTFNLDDFPAHALTPHHVEAKHPDDFVLESLDLAPGVVLRALLEQAADLHRPPMRAEDILERLRRLGLVRAVARFHELLSR